MGIDKSAAVTTRSHALDQLTDPLKQILRVLSRRVAPVPVTLLGSLALAGRGGNVDAAELGAHDGRAGIVLAARVRAGDGRDEQVAAGLEAEDGVEACARLLQLGAVGIVVEGGEVCEDVLPAAVVVDAPRGIDDPRISH